MIDISKGRYWDLPWSLIDGCTPCSPGCDHCWSAGIAHRFYREGEPGHCTGILTDDKGRFNGDIITHPERLSIPLKRKKPTVYAVWNDLFHEAVPDEFIKRVVFKMTVAVKHTFLVLTKRPGRMLSFYTHPQPWPTLSLDNVWFGCTVVNQQEADEKIPIFLQVPGKKFLSIEPMLGEIDLTDIGPARDSGAHGWSCLWDTPLRSRIGAVILGGETSGNRPGREMKIEWAENVADQCEAAGVPLFVKQLHIGGKVSKDITEWPLKLQRRELPWKETR